MKKLLYILIIIFSISSCKREKRIIEKIDFKTRYKFSSVIKNKLAKDTISWKYVMAYNDYSNKGDYRNALINFDITIGEGKEESLTKKEIDSINTYYVKVNAADYINQKAKESQIVIINEAHHNPSHRVFTKSLLKKLFDQGYTNLGLEALSSHSVLDSSLNKRKYPIQKTGYYTKDPQFGDLIRTALEIGYHVFPYESENGSGKQREIEQAKNIQKVIQEKPNEKFLIHCGYDHALEGSIKSWEKAMAGRLTEYTGINPLTITQTAYRERSEHKFSPPLLKALDPKEPTILIDQNNNSLKHIRKEAWIDIVVFHPITKYVNNRPNWLFENDNKNIPIRLDDIEIEFPVMVLAFKKGEDISIAVPMDITEITNKSEKVNLGLKKGIYDIVVTNGKESLKFDKKVK